MGLERILSKLSVPGLALLAMGVLTVTQAQRLCRLVLKEQGERLITPIKIFGLALSLLGALILLDVFPGL